MLRNLRKKPDLTFARIYHTGMSGREIWEQNSHSNIYSVLKTHRKTRHVYSNK